MARADQGKNRTATVLRHEAIVALLKTQGALSVNQLAMHFGCSPATIRRDLKRLSREMNDVRRFHGAAAMEPELLERGFQEKLAHSYQEKLEIAAAVVNWLPASGVLGLNGGTTTTLIARQLARAQKRLTVVTNAVNIAFELTNSSIPVVVVGGALRPSNYETTGPAALDTLRGLHLDWAVLGANGVDPRFGASTTTELEAAVGRTFALQADCVVVAADHTKLGFNALFQMVEWGAVHFLATDRGADDLLGSWGIRPAARGFGEQAAAVLEVHPVGA
jgi:DeoR family transcriptional regulator of aga operon